MPSRVKKRALQWLKVYLPDSQLPYPESKGRSVSYYRARLGTASNYGANSFAYYIY